MQDIDFDELDRAVNSTLDSKPTRSDASDDSSVPVSVTRSEPSTTSPAPAARRSSGRFMDVVHPSSDMRSSSTPERSAPRPPEPREESPAPEPVSADTTWPDPLDFHGFKDDAPAPEPVVEDKKEDAPAASLESPFLSDAKVEKRPLGAFSTESADETPLLEAPDEELLPAETETHDEPAQPEMTTEPEVEPEVQPEPEPTPAPELTEEPVGPTSITQQYNEQPSTTDQPSGAIYDTEAYHQPLAHPEKKRSSVLIIVWIIALILIGGGVGAGVYFFVLPML